MKMYLMNILKWQIQGEVRRMVEVTIRFLIVQQLTVALIIHM